MLAGCAGVDERRLLAPLDLQAREVAAPELVASVEHEPVLAHVGGQAEPVLGRLVGLPELAGHAVVLVAALDAEGAEVVAQGGVEAAALVAVGHADPRSGVPASVEGHVTREGDPRRVVGQVVEPVARVDPQVFPGTGRERGVEGRHVDLARELPGGQGGEVRGHHRRLDRGVGRVGDEGRLVLVPGAVGQVGAETRRLPELQGRPRRGHDCVVVGGSESSPRAGPRSRDEPMLSVARKGLSKDWAGMELRNQL